MSFIRSPFYSYYPFHFFPSQSNFLSKLFVLISLHLSYALQVAAVWPRLPTTSMKVLLRLPVILCESNGHFLVVTLLGLLGAFDAYITPFVCCLGP